MKRSIILLTLIALLSVVSAYADSVLIGGLFYNIDYLHGTTATVTSPNYRLGVEEYSGDITIPTEVTYNQRTYPVTSIGWRAFAGCTGLTSITIPNSVTSIGEKAFYSCTGLTSITIPNSVTSIGKYAFDGCTSLTSITIPNSVTSIGEKAFYSCTGLTSVSIGNGVTSIGDYAFSGCTGLTSVTIGNSVTSIGEYAFEDCWRLTSVTIPNSVTSIGWDAFAGCTGLTSITIPNSVTSIGNCAFYGCTGLTSITIPNSVTSIGAGAFEKCSGLTSIVVESGNTIYDSRENCNAIIETATNELIQGCNTTIIPNSVTSIGSSAFRGCIGLTSITIPNSVTSIKSYTFSGCAGLTSITIPNSVTSIGWDAFTGCTGLTSITIPNSVTSIEISAFYGCTGLTSVTIPNSVTSIGGSAFSGCTGLTSVTIGNSVTSIGENAFKGCTALTSVVWNAKKCGGWGDGYDSPFSSVRDSIISFTFGNEVDSIPAYLCFGMSKLTSITFPSNLTTIGSCVLEGCTSLTSVVWNVKNMADFSSKHTPFYYYYYHSSIDDFDLRSQITSFTFGDEVESIPAYLCCSMSNLTSITIPKSVKSINRDAFEDCTNLTSVVWNAKKCDSSPFYSARDNITSFTFGNEVESIPAYLCSTMSKLTSITIQNSVTSIGKSAFYNCTGLTSVTIGNSVTSIGEYAFEDCWRLTSVTIPNSVTSIGAWAFEKCSGLTSVTIGNSVTSIGEHAFYDCDGITSITIPNSVTSIGDEAFYNCDGITSITIPNSVTSIGEGAFSDCYSLTSMAVESSNMKYDSRNNCNAIIETATNTLTHGCKTTVIPNSVTSIGDYAFYYCAGPTSVTIPNSVTSIGERAFYRCNGLTSITIPNSVTSIGKEAFYYCKRLTILCKAVNLGSEAFKYCSSLTIGEDVKRITGTSAFSNSLSQINVRAEVPPTITSTTFENVPTYIPVYVPCGMKETYQVANEWQKFSNLIESLGLSMSITTQNELMGSVKITKKGASCEESESVFEAIANAGYLFTRWSDGNTDNPRHLVLTQDTVLVAQFRAVCSYTLKVDCNPLQGSVSGSGTYAETEPVTITATPNTGYRFLQWSDGNTDNPRTLTLTSDITLSAEFVTASFLVRATATNGSVSGTGAFDYGDEATLTVTADNGYRFLQWADGNTDNPRTIVVTQDTVLTAQCEAANYTITATCNPQQGSVVGSGTYADGAQVTLVALANKGYEFTQWSNGVTNNPYQFTATEDLTLEAEFIPATAIDNTVADTDTTPRKVLFNGQVYILRNGKTYTLTGVEVE